MIQRERVDLDGWILCDSVLRFLLLEALTITSHMAIAAAGGAYEVEAFVLHAVTVVVKPKSAHYKQ